MWAAWYARAQKAIAARAADEAKRSADAAAEVAEIERNRRAEEVAAAEAGRVKFELIPESGSTYLLANTGTESAFGVHVDTGGMGTSGEEVDFDEFPANEGCRYVLGRGYGSHQADHVLVTWHHLPDLSDPPRSAKLIGP